MGRMKESGAGKQYGSHTPAVCDGSLPGAVREREIVLNCPSEGLVRTVDIRPTRWAVRVVVPDVRLPSAEEARDIVLTYSVGVDPRSLACRRMVRGERVLVSYETLEEYIAEIPENVLCVFAWYLGWWASGRGKMSELPSGFYGQITALRREYTILSRALSAAEGERQALRSERALERLEAYSEDDGHEVRSSSVRAAEALSGLRGGGGGGDRESGSPVAASQVVVNINLENAFLPRKGDVVDADGAL